VAAACAAADRRCALAQPRCRLPWLHGLDDARAPACAGTRFLHEKTITPISSRSCTAGSVCCWPRCAACRCWSSARWAWSGWSQLIVYPDAFRVHRSHMDAAGVLHEWDDELSKRGTAVR
jgi:Mlc titration factor MtfA (ptsG expression regulator)